MRRPYKILISFLCLCLVTLAAISFFTGERAEQFNIIPEEPATSSAHELKSIEFDKRNFTYSGDARDISFDGDILTVLSPGDYRISGRLTEGRIRVSCPNGRVRLILSGVSLSSSYGAVIESDSGSNLILEAEKDTVNILSSELKESRYEHLPSAAVILRSYTEILGEGKIIIDSAGDCGILSLQSLKLNVAHLTVNAKAKGIAVRDSLYMSGGRLTVKDVPTGIFAGFGDTSEGRISISGGTLTALCGEVAIFAQREILVSGGTAGIDAKQNYGCFRTENGKKIQGKITVTASGFPKYNSDSE